MAARVGVILANDSKQRVRRMEPKLAGYLVGKGKARYASAPLRAESPEPVQDPEPFHLPDPGPPADPFDPLPPVEPEDPPPQEVEFAPTGEMAEEEGAPKPRRRRRKVVTETED